MKRKILILKKKKYRIQIEINHFKIRLIVILCPFYKSSKSRRKHSFDFGVRSLLEGTAFESNIKQILFDVAKLVSNMLQ